MVNTKRDYLRALRRALVWRLPPGETQGIISDYEGFFASGGQEGRTEEELCRQFGPPAQVARDILREEGRRGFPLGYLAFVWLAAAVLLVGADIRVAGVGIYLGGMMWSRAFEYPAYYTLAAALMPLLWLFWHRAVPAAPPRHRAVFRLVCALPLAVWGVPFVRVWLFDRSGTLWVLRTYTDTTGGSFTAYELADTARETLIVFFECGSTILALLLALSLVLAWRESLWYLAAAAHTLGAMMAVEQLIYTLSWLSHSYELITGPLADSLCVYLGIAVGGTVVTALLVGRGPAWEERLKTAAPEGFPSPARRDATLLLVLAWPVLAVFLTRATQPQFDWSFALRPAASLLIVPALSLFWRNIPPLTPVEGTDRRALGVLTLVPAALWLAFSGFIVWGVSGGGSPGIGIVAARFYFTARTLTALSMLLCLARAWMGSGVFLLPAAQCAGVLGSIGVWYALITNMSLTELLPLTRSAVLPLTAYALGWVGGLAALCLLRRGTAHGRAA